MTPQGASGKPQGVLVVNPPVPDAGLAKAADAAGAVGLVDPLATTTEGVTGALVRSYQSLPSTVRTVLLTVPDAAAAERYASEGRRVLAVASDPATVPAAHALVARGATGAETVAATKRLASRGRPVFAWGGLDRTSIARAREAGASGFVVDAAFWTLPESPLPEAEKSALASKAGAEAPLDAKLAPFVARRSRTLAGAIRDLLSDAAVAAPSGAAAVAGPFGPAAVVPTGTAVVPTGTTVTPRDAASPPAKPATAAAERPPPQPKAATATAERPPPQPQAATAPVAHSVAIIGMGCMFPGAPDVASFWRFLLAGASAIREVSPSRWDPRHYFDADPKAPDKTYSKIGAFIDEVPFDPLPFKIPPSTARALDGVQQMALLAARAALEDAGHQAIPNGPGKPFDRKRCAVILGNSMGGEVRHATGRRIYVDEFATHFADVVAPEVLAKITGRVKESLPPVTEDTMPGELANVVAGRIANILNLAGPNFTTDAACASSLAALDAASRALASGEVDLVLCGGADRSMDPEGYVKFAKIGALSATGSKPFDRDADGFVQGEGAGIVVLKRLADAVRDGDRVWAVVRGVGSASDGRGKGITAPNPDGQLLAIERAMARAEIPPASVQVIECHGTGTPVGDVVELETLARVYRGLPPASIPIGSVKSQIGHLKSAAGAAALVKAVLALHHGTVPPTINVRTPNPRIAWAEIPFFPNTATRPWPEVRPGEPRRAAISAFGFGGTNFHAIVEQFLPEYHVRAGATGQDARGKTGKTDDAAASSRLLASLPPCGVVVLGADEASGLVREARTANERLAREPRATAASRGRAAAIRKPFRAAVVGGPEALDLVGAGADPKALALKGVHVGHGAPGKVAFLFPGQGSQYAGMLKDLWQDYPVVRETFEEADRVLAPYLGKPLTEFLDDEAALTRTEITQPAVLAADVALLRLLSQWGVRPDFVAGHSLGEYAALVAAGVLRFEDALVAVSARGREMANVHVPDLGKMAGVASDAKTVERLLADVPGYVVAANKNAPDQIVIAGETKAVDAALQRFAEQGIPAQELPVSAAFHSAIVAPASEPLRRVLERLEIRPPTVPVIANVDAKPYPSERAAILD
ncbi:MAG: type I polyketide synthase, partial [Methanobacteriota archaeon]